MKIRLVIKLFGNIMYYYIQILNFRIHESLDFSKIESFWRSIFLIRHKAYRFLFPCIGHFQT